MRNRINRIKSTYIVKLAVKCINNSMDLLVDTSISMEKFIYCKIEVFHLYINYHFIITYHAFILVSLTLEFSEGILLLANVNLILICWE